MRSWVMSRRYHLLDCIAAGAVAATFTRSGLASAIVTGLVVSVAVVLIEKFWR